MKEKEVRRTTLGHKPRPEYRKPVTGRFRIVDGVIVKNIFACNSPYWGRKGTLYSRAREKPMYPKALIVDDEKMVRDSVKRLALKAGFRKEDVVCVGSGKEALELLKSGESFKLVILDLIMAGMSGNQVVKTLNEEGMGNIVRGSVVVHSGTLSEDLEEQTANEVCGRILQKGNTEVIVGLLNYALKKDNKVEDWSPPSPFSGSSS